MKRVQKRRNVRFKIVGVFLLGAAVVGLGLWRQGVIFAPAAPRGLYVALGDSVAAGYGLPIARDASQADALCGRSPQAYPVLVAHERNMRLRTVACSGAVTADLLQPRTVSGLRLPAQIAAAYADVHDRPRLISLTIGANDTHWTNFIKTCYAGDCATPANTAAADAALAPLQASVVAALSDIAARGHGHPPRVVVTGYYDLVASRCYALQSSVTADEVTWFRAETAKLNDALRSATASYAFARFAVANFTGHDLCGANSWIQGVTDAGPLHPTAAGQTALAQAVLAAAAK